MAEVIGFKIEANSDQASQSVGSLKKQLKEAQQDVQALSDKFGATSEQAVAAAKKAAELKDRIGDAKALTDAFNPDAKFKAFSASLSAVAGGFSAVQGAMGLMGTKSEEVEKTLLKVQSAMALSQGLQAVGEGIDSFKQMKTVAVDAFKSIKAAIGSTGIGLLVVALGTIYAYWDDIKAAVSGVSSEQEKLLKDSEKNLSVEKDKLSTINGQDNILKLQGKSEKDILKIKIAQTDQVIKATEENIRQQKVILKAQIEAEKRNKEILSGMLLFVTTPLQLLIDGVAKVASAFGVNFEFDIAKSIAGAVFDPKEVKDKGEATIKELDKQLGELKNQRAGFQLSIQDIDNKSAEQTKDKNKKINDDKLQAQKEAAKNIQKLQDEIFLQSIKDDTQRALVKLSQDKERQILDINASKASAKEKADQIALIEQQFQQNKDAIESDAAKKTAENAANKLKERLDNENAIRIAAIKDEFERKKAELLVQEETEKADLDKKRADGLVGEEAYQQGLLNIRDKYATATTEVIKKQAEDEKKIQEARKAAQLEFYDTVAQGFGALSGLFGQGTAASKTFALAEIAISSATGFARGLDIAQQSAKAAGPGAAFAFPLFYAQQALAVINIINKARNILKTVKGGSSGSPSVGGTSSPSVAAAPIAPATPGATLTQLDQSTINRLGSATNRAYVLETDVTNSQERIRRINRAARLN